MRGIQELGSAVPIHCNIAGAMETPLCIASFRNAVARIKITTPAGFKASRITVSGPDVLTSLI